MFTTLRPPGARRPSCRVAPLLAGTLAALLAACAGPIAERAFDEVAAGTERQLGSRPLWKRSEADEQAARAVLAARLAEPLSPEGAVAVALVNNPGLQAAFAGLGIGAAELARARRPANPGFSYSRLHRSGESQIDRSLTIEPLGLLLLPFTAAVEERRFEAGRLAVLNRVMSVAAATRRAWYEAVAARRIAALGEAAHEQAEVQAELAQRMRRAGNWSSLDLARQRLFLAETEARRVAARNAAAASEGRLARLLGPDVEFRLPDDLPALPAAPRAAGDVAAAALADRPDVRAARAEVDATAAAWHLTGATRFVNLLELGYQRNSESGLSVQQGYEIGLEVPLFDLGDGKASEAEYLWRRAVARLAQAALEARLDAGEAHRRYLAAYGLAQRWRDEVAPLGEQVRQEMLLRYNGMLASVFELLQSARELNDGAVALVEAERDFWLADTDLAFVALAAPAAPGRD